jgi:hypothetical protein
MIDGFRVRMTHEELAQHCSRVADRYNSQADTAEKEASALADKEGATWQSLASEVGRARKIAKAFRFYSTHLFCCDYSLAIHDLTALELVRDHEYPF